MGAFPQPFPKRAFPLPFPKGTGDETFASPGAFPQPFPEGTGDETFASPSPSGEGWGEASVY